jgi:hypothetical protein
MLLHRPRKPKTETGEPGTETGEPGTDGTFPKGGRCGAAIGDRAPDALAFDH